MVNLIAASFLFLSAISFEVQAQEDLSFPEQPVEAPIEEVFGEDEEEPIPEPPYVDAEEADRARRLRKLREQKKAEEGVAAGVPEGIAGEPEVAAPKVEANQNDQEGDKENIKGGRVRRRYIKHPHAEKGLYKITKEGDYLYKVNKSPVHGRASIKLGPFSAPDFVSSANGFSYDDLYGSGDIMLLADYEWSLSSYFPGLGLKVGSGLLFASGSGRLTSTGQTSLEDFSFVMFPNHVSLSLKFHIWDRQKLVPYVEGGAGAFVFTEQRDDNEPAFGRWGAAYNLHAVGGLAFNITSLSSDAALRIDREYGINDVWLTAEVRQLIGFGNFDTTTTLFNAGVALDF